jgi:hypothetical protein
VADLITSFSDAELHDLEDKAEAAMAAALDAVMEIIASRIERNARPITSAAGDEPTKEPGQPYVSPDDLASIGPLWDEQVQQRLMPMVAQVYQDSAGQIHASLVDAVDLPDLPAASSLAAETYLAGVQNVYRNVGTDLWSTARTELQEGFKRGESIDELAARVRGAGKISARNAELVARSTVIEASNAGSIATARASGLDMQKEWINTHDARTRPTHQDEALGGVGGQRVDLNAQFTVGGFSADAPGDPTLPPQEKYRCRCTVGYVMGKRDVAQAHAEAHQQAEQQALPNTTPSPAQAAPTQTTAEQVTAERRARRQAARARSAEIEAAKPYADLAAEIDQNVAAAGGRWTPTFTKVLQQRVDSARVHGVSAESVDRIERAIRNQNFADLEDVTARMASNVGLRSFGIRGERMAFDPDTMEAIGEAGFEPGQMVQVFRQGHVLTLTDGTTVQISRAVVRTPPVGRTRPLSGIMDHLWPRSWQGKASDDAFEQAKGDLASAFEGRFGSLVARVDAVHEPDRLDHPNGFMINGSILNADGEQVGVFTRVLYRATGDHPSYVANAYLRIDSSAQGSGFASQLNKTMFDWYRQAGIDHVEVHANIDVGGYTWAAQGFDFANPSAAAAWRESMRETLAQYDGQPETLASELGLSVDDARGQIKHFRQMLGAQQAGQSVSAYAFSQVGRKKGQGKNDLWIGKFMMLGSGWDGVLPL